MRCRHRDSSTTTFQTCCMCSAWQNKSVQPFGRTAHCCHADHAASCSEFPDKWPKSSSAYVKLLCKRGGKKKGVLILVFGHPGKVEYRFGSRAVRTAVSATPSHWIQCHWQRDLGKHKEAQSHFTGLFLRLLFCTFPFSLQKLSVAF